MVSLFARQVSAIPCSRKKSEPFTGKVGETTGQMQMGMLHITVGLLPSEKQIHGIGLQSKQEIPRPVKDKDIYSNIGTVTKSCHDAKAYRNQMA